MRMGHSRRANGFRHSEDGDREPMLTNVNLRLVKVYEGQLLCSSQEHVVVEDDFRAKERNQERTTKKESW